MLIFLAPPTDKEWKCARKRRYRSKKVALSRAATSTKRSGEIIEAYKCPYCRQYHIGHAKKSAA